MNVPTEQEVADYTKTVLDILERKSYPVLYRTVRDLGIPEDFMKDIMLESIAVSKTPGCRDST